MDFRTELALPPSSFTIDLSDPLLTQGSCFSQSIGQQFITNKFKVMINPFGTSYHPFAIHKLLTYAACQEYPATHTYGEHDGIHFNYDFHSDFSHMQHAVVQERIRESIAAVHFYLKNCKVLLLTYGTALAYERNDTGEPVSNCHKIPSSAFTRCMTTVTSIAESFQTVRQALASINPTLRVILTVSPVRHVKDTLPLNCLSKSTLRLACDQILEKNKQVEYFPAYEIMMDDLRDYRFYKDDLIHPTLAAEDYIWEKFTSTYLNKSALQFIKQWKDIQKALNHRAFQAESKSHKLFVQQTLLQLEKLRIIVNVEKEIEQLRSQL